MSKPALPRLSNATLSGLPEGVQRPNYDRSTANVGIVHLGIGAFHRAHQAVYIDDLLADEPDWGIVGVSLRRADTKDALSPQDGLYALSVRDGLERRARVIGSILDVLVLDQDRDAIMAHLVAPRIRIVSLTVTEKGYCHDPASGRLDETNPDVMHDLANPEKPLSAPGLIVEALARRHAAGLPPFTVLSCDNLPANGLTCRRIVTRFATLRDEALGKFIEKNVAFPSTMVDRIVPATTDEVRAEVARLTGVEDAWPIATEPFTQWVVEDHFPNGRPRFESVGVELVEDVEPFELMKLRMLNGSHSTLAYLGYLSGYQTVAGTVEDPQFATLLRNMMTEEIMPTLDMPVDNLSAYRDALMLRFSNAALQHRTWQIAMDGSQKLPQRLLGTISDRLAAGAPCTRLCLGVAGWMMYVRGVDEKGQPIDVRDPLAERLKAHADAHADDVDGYVDGLLAMRDIFSEALGTDAAFRAQLLDHIASLNERGALATVMALNVAQRT